MIILAYMNVHSLVAEPIGDGSTGLEALPELSAGDIESLNTLGHLIDGLVLIRRGKIRHHLERHHLDLELIVVLRNQILSVVRAVEVLSL